MGHYTIRLTWLAIVCMAITGCYDRAVRNEPTVIRDYRTDAQIMSRFIDVDESTGQLYLNGNKRILASDYVLNQSREEFDCVSDINRRKFNNELENANRMLTTLRGHYGVSAIAYSLYNSRYFINMSENLLGTDIDPTSRKRMHILHTDITPAGAAPVQFKCHEISGIQVTPGQSGDVIYVGIIALKDCKDDNTVNMIVVGINDGNSPLPFSINLPHKLNRTWEVSGTVLTGSDNPLNTVGIDFVQ